MTRAIACPSSGASTIVRTNSPTSTEPSERVTRVIWLFSSLSVGTLPEKTIKASCNRLLSSSSEACRKLAAGCGGTLTVLSCRAHAALHIDATAAHRLTTVNTLARLMKALAQGTEAAAYRRRSPPPVRCPPAGQAWYQGYL